MGLEVSISKNGVWVPIHFRTPPPPPAPEPEPEPETPGRVAGLTVRQETT